VDHDPELGALTFCTQAEGMALDTLMQIAMPTAAAREAMAASAGTPMVRKLKRRT
jgi:hypothetical protein